jgi:hypothetical protein
MSVIVYMIAAGRGNGQFWRMGGWRIHFVGWGLNLGVLQ